MDKLIDYEGLGTFQTNLLNDNKLSQISTWSSYKIKDEITTDLLPKQNTLIAGQNINISSDTISVDGFVFDSSRSSIATIYKEESETYGVRLVPNTATGESSHSEGEGTIASGEASHAEGLNTTASNVGAHAEGIDTVASGDSSHTEGQNTTASGVHSHAEGFKTIAQNRCEHTEGQSNVSHKANTTFGNAGNTIHSIGIGVWVGQTQSYDKKNAVEVMQNGDMYVYGVGGYQGTNTKVQDATIKTLQEYILSLEARIYALEHQTTIE